MPQTPHINRRVLLAARPHGKPVPQDFRLDETPVPEPQDGQVLLRTLYLSLDPYMRNLMNAAGASYAPAVAVGAPMVGGTVNRVVASRHPDFRAGDLVLGNAGWQDYALSDGSGLTPLGDMPRPSLALGALGMTAFTAYVGLLDIGQPQPGETVVVGAATGAVGAVVGQLARLKGARVIGIAGGADKCRLAVEELGYDSCLDRHAPQLAAHLAAVCPNGIDVYFESVGGEVLDAVLPLLNNHARVPVCGIIAHYNDGAPPAGPDHRPALLSTVLQKRIRMQGFVILDHYATRFADFRREMGEWVAAGRVKTREDVVDGLEQAPDAFIGLLEGRNAGKLVVRVAGD
ncbi:NADP-dependent oxidoreductase [Rhodanobacter sp. 7MK24]|uniref:NADP-dependent oxidoreductase n=1 Tax=Rhodanobacter sp. 7MK24 TaxID=2775922 RepID=UPI0017815AEA|nr:NADP-dependent oxidoreductase [Rhodanobacter sp. 7MK24]MBD8881734.1 NADP-dependent oxidoreductase [Rhodanobacter sp. 7MK24]